MLFPVLAGSHFILFFILFSRLIKYNKYQYIQTRRKKTVYTANYDKITANRGCRAVLSNLETQHNNHGNPPWKTGAAL